MHSAKANILQSYCNHIWLKNTCSVPLWRYFLVESNQDDFVVTQSHFFSPHCCERKNNSDMFSHQASPSMTRFRRGLNLTCIFTLWQRDREFEEIICWGLNIKVSFPKQTENDWKLTDFWPRFRSKLTAVRLTAWLSASAYSYYKEKSNYPTLQLKLLL